MSDMAMFQQLRVNSVTILRCPYPPAANCEDELFGDRRFLQVVDLAVSVPAAAAEAK